MSKKKRLDAKTEEELQELFSDAIDELKKGKRLEGQDGAVTPLLKKLIETSLDGEADAHVNSTRPNRRNGKASKKVRTSYGEMEIDTPRDRDGSFDPQLVGKRERDLGPSLERKVISLYSNGTSYRDIASHIEEMYGMELSPAQLSAITDKVWPEIEEWRQRPLEEVYPFVWLDALFYKVRKDGTIKKMAAYMVLGMDLEGKKDLLGIYIAETESANFWMEVLTDLQTRGVKDILIACIDNLTGFKEAIEAIFPKTDVQLCIVHQVRNSLRYVPWKHHREVIKDMKAVYRASDLQAAEQALQRLEEKWGEKYPSMVRSWKRNWEGLSSFYDHPLAVRKIMYTTNSIEGFHRQIRKATKSKGAFPSEDALYKMLYLVSKKVKKQWGPPRSWREVLSTLAIKYPERLGLH